MHQVLEDVAIAIVDVLQCEFPKIGQDWWQSCVVDRLSIQQQRLVSDRRCEDSVRESLMLWDPIR